jgi:hypothetical protein
MIITRNGEDFSEINPLITGQAPDFSLKDQHGNAVTLSKLPSPIIMSVFQILIPVSAQFKHVGLTKKLQHTKKLLSYQFQIIHQKNKLTGVRLKRRYDDRI